MIRHRSATRSHRKPQWDILGQIKSTCVFDTRKGSLIKTTRPISLTFFAQHGFFNLIRSVVLF